MSDMDGLIDELTVGVAVTDERGRMMYANQAARNLMDDSGGPGEAFSREIPGAADFAARGRPVSVEFAGAGGIELVGLFHRPASRAGRAAALLYPKSEFAAMTQGLSLNHPDSQALKAIISSSYDGLWLIDHTGAVVLVNHGAELMHRVKKEDVIGKTVEELIQMKLMDRSATREVIRHKKSLTINQVVPRLEKEILVTANPIFDSQGDLKYVVIIDRDVTELNRLRRELQESQLIQERIRANLPVPLENESMVKNGVICSESMKRLYEQAVKAAQSDATILITGESGVGKGFLVRFIHEASLCRTGPLVHLDCGAVPESLIDSELFGYESGAFTGARKEGKPGFLEAADGGVLFLDEVSELPIGAQVKLLRFLDSNEFNRVGGVVVRKSRARIIAASNRDLEKMVKAGEFRNDLYFRLNVVPLIIPPLRERRDGLPNMINYFLELMNARNKTHKTIDRKALDHLYRYSYPGNVRELINLIEQLVVLSPGDVITVEDLPQQVLVEVSPLTAWTRGHGWNLRHAVDELEREMIIQALKRFGTQRKAAEYLGIDQSTLARKAKKYGLRYKMIIHRGD